MAPDLTSRARQLLADIGLKEPSGDPPEIIAQYDLLVDRVADHLRQVREECAPERIKAAKERDALASRLEQANHVIAINGLNEKTCLAEIDRLESARASLRALLAEAGEAMRNAAQTLRQVPVDIGVGSIAWKDAVELELRCAAIQTALRETPTPNAKASST
jgi:uncharacterized membrane protein YccC